MSVENKIPEEDVIITKNGELYVKGKVVIYIAQNNEELPLMLWFLSYDGKIYKFTDDFFETNKDIIEKSSANAGSAMRCCITPCICSRIEETKDGIVVVMLVPFNRNIPDHILEGIFNESITEKTELFVKCFLGKDGFEIYLNQNEKCEVLLNDPRL